MEMIGSRLTFVWYWDQSHCFFDPLDPEYLDRLLELDESTSRSTLRQLHSIAIVPDAGGGAVRLIHPSVHDFSH